MNLEKQYDTDALIVNEVKVTTVKFYNIKKYKIYAQYKRCQIICRLVKRLGGAEWSCNINIISINMKVSLQIQQNSQLDA